MDRKIDRQRKADQMICDFNAPMEIQLLLSAIKLIASRAPFLPGHQAAIDFCHAAVECLRRVEGVTA